ncbi:GntR family transcriptional regulator [Micromonospora sp. CPCC 205371]|nr:GntR family transcriptional regulator [Micromonospora sp. CPCC 205371]
MTAPAPKIVQPVPASQQVADILREGIVTGRYPAGQPLPSLERLADEMGTTRYVIRQGVAQLVLEGLVIVRRPYGTIVRDIHARPTTVQQQELTVTDGQWHETGPAWHDIGEPTYIRQDATTSHADLFDIPPGQPMLTRDTLQTTGPAGTTNTGAVRRSVRLHMPFSVAADLETPWLDDAHLWAPSDVYAYFAGAGHTLTFTDHIRARMPVADEAATLQMPPGTPLLIVARAAATEGRTLTLEETRLPADKAELAYPVPVNHQPGRSTPVR